MKKLNFIDATYHNSDNIEVQGRRELIQKYLDKGYSIKKSNNDVYVLRQPTHVMVFLEDSNGKSYELDISSSVLRYYRAKGFSYPLFLNFLDDASRGKVNFYIKNGTIILRKK